MHSGGFEIILLPTKWTIIFVKRRTTISHSSWSRLHHRSLLFQVYSFNRKNRHSNPTKARAYINYNNLVTGCVFTLFWIFVTNLHDLNIRFGFYPAYLITAVCSICAGKQRVREKIVSAVAYESIVRLIILLGCLSFSSSLTAKMDFLQLQCDPQTDSISMKKHLDQGFMEKKQSCCKSLSNKYDQVSRWIKQRESI